ncbi:flagellar hook-length control protein FliK [Poseidonocella sp. HB161398]|uniref:flagellar hook-length control protein FliK n=1 Tax=Poseidonocella sp. HB161398 TaxID=2320855 RepID=UPI001107A869|nr:flagellar hook-length control protein FliK [Poseidonocella sp. HB161398]
MQPFSFVPPPLQSKDQSKIPAEMSRAPSQKVEPAENRASANIHQPAFSIDPDPDPDPDPVKEFIFFTLETRHEAEPHPTELEPAKTPNEDGTQSLNTIEESPSPDKTTGGEEVEKSDEIEHEFDAQTQTTSEIIFHLDQKSDPEGRAEIRNFDTRARIEAGSSSHFYGEIGINSTKAPCVSPLTHDELPLSETKSENQKLNVLREFKGSKNRHTQEITTHTDNHEPTHNNSRIISGLSIEENINSTPTSLDEEAISTVHPRQKHIHVSSLESVLELVDELSKNDHPLNTKTSTNNEIDRSDTTNRAMQEHSISKQIASSIKENSTSSHDINLDPPELGKLRITIDTRDGNTHISFSVEKYDTSILIRRNLLDLERSLLEVGGNALSFSFSDGDKNRDSAPNQSCRNEIEKSTPKPSSMDPLEPSVKIPSDTIDVRI